jgi:hypothetical protein
LLEELGMEIEFGFWEILILALVAVSSLAGMVAVVVALIFFLRRI